MSAHTVAAYRHDLLRLGRILRAAQDGALERVRQFADARLRRRPARRRHWSAQHSAAAVGRANVLRIPDARGPCARNPALDVRAPKTEEAPARRRSMPIRWAGCWHFASTIPVGARQGHHGAVLLLGAALDRTGGASTWLRVDLEDRTVRVLGKGGKSRIVPIGRQAIDCARSDGSRSAPRWSKTR